jgi:capsular exopolysaccharide synthesis family protein
LNEIKEGQAAPRSEQGSSRASITIDEYKSVRQELFRVDLELAEAEAWLASAKAAAEAAVRRSKNPTPVVDVEQDDLLYQRIVNRFRMDPDVIKLADDMKSMKERLYDVRRTARQKGDPAEMRHERNLAALQDKYDRLWESKSLAFRQEFERGGNKLDPQQEVDEVEVKVQRLRNKKASLTKSSKELEVSNKRQATDQVDIALIVDERNTLRNMQEAVHRRLEQLNFEAKGEARIRLVNAAMVPQQPIANKRNTYLAMTPVGILGTVLCLVVLLEIRAGRVADPEVLSSRMKHEVFTIAPLPDLRPGDGANSGKAEQRLARFVQSLDHLRVALCEGGIPGEGRCVMITSATGGEGKTTLSAHLAARCANSGTSTLLIDADLRRASLGRLLDVPVGPGLGDVLGGDIDLDEALITVQAGGFHFLSAGTPGRDPSRVLKSTRLSELINRLRRTYDLVIIDTPPVLPVADALIMGRWADGAVMAARFDASRLPLVERANRQLALAGIPVLGVVVNGVRGQDATYGNYAYNYNYYQAQDNQSDEAPTR